MLTLFWGAEVKPGKPLPYVPPPEEARLHLSQASLSASCPSGQKVALKCKVTDGPELQLCTFKEGQFENCPLDLLFDHYTEFMVEGQASVHITGYFVPDQPEEEEECIQLGGEDDDDDEDDGEFLPGNLDFQYLQNDEDFSSDDFEEEDDESDEDDNDDEEQEDGGAQARKTRVYPNVVIEEEEDAQPVKQPEATPRSVADETTAAGSTAGRKRKGGDIAGGDTKKATPHADSVAPSAGGKKSAAPKTPLEAKSSKANGEAPSEKKTKTPNSASSSKADGKAQQLQNGSATKQTNKEKKQKTTKADPQARELTTDAAGGKKKMRKFENGFIIEELAMGSPTGKLAKPGKKVVVKYIGRLASNNKVFDKTSGNATFTFRLGVGEVIKGWDKGVEGMRVGDKRRLTVPPQMGYGSNGARPTIPPNATLIFEVELVDVK